MSKELEKQIEALQSTIKVLQNENDLLAERAEETILISKISQSINSANESAALLDSILEQVSILTNVSYSAYCELKGEKAIQLHTYSSFSEDDQFSELEFIFSAEILNELKATHSCLVGSKELERKKLQANFDTADFNPHAALIYSFTSSQVSDGVFVFIDDETRKNKLELLQLLLQNVVNMTVEKLEKISLVERLKSANSQLDQRIKERTESLLQSNQKLRNEIIVRQLAEDSLKNSEAFLSAMFASIQDGISVLDTDLNILKVNDVMTGFYHDRLPLIGKKCHSCYHLREEPCEDCPVLKSLKTGKTEMSIVPGPVDSPIKWIELFAHPIKEANSGEITGIVEFVRDITERVEAEEKLIQLRKYLSNIIDSMPSVLIGVDTECRITQWNKTAETISGVPASQALGKIIGENFTRLQNDHTYILQSIEKGEVNQMQKRPFISENGIRYEDITIYPLVTDGMEGAVIRIDDVTEQVQLEEAMVQSEKMMSVGGLAAGMAHEINNPLSAILSSAQTIERRFSKELKKNKETSEKLGIDFNLISDYLTQRDIPVYLSGIREAGERAANIVRNMLDFSRKAESVRVECDLHKIIDKSLDLASNDYDLKKRYDFRAIKIEKQFDEALPKVHVIETEIGQVFLNLFKNAAQAMIEKKFDSNHPTLTLRTRTEQGWICAEVEDNGSGMDDETRKRIFEPFFTTKGAGIGTGLGLSVSYFIITKNHKGKFIVESQKGIGSKFIIKIPDGHSELKYL